MSHTLFRTISPRWHRLIARGSILVSMILTAFVFSFQATAAEEQRESTEDPKEEIAKPEELTLPTADGLELALTYYPGNKGKETVPVVLLHMWKQNGNDFTDLAKTLQADGCAVIVPDLRGHGKSTKAIGGRRDEPLNAAALTPNQFNAMVAFDMATVKRFLWEKNNAGELNIDKLCVAGAEMGASVALNFALVDAWDQDRNRIPRPSYKRGRFVKALVLISPELSFRGLPIRSNSARQIPDVAMLILVGKQDNKALEQANRVHGMFEKFHPEPTGSNAIDHKTLFYGKLDARLQGTKLLDPKFNVSAIIADFIYRRLVKSDESGDWTWRERQLP